MGRWNRPPDRAPARCTTWPSTPGTPTGCSGWPPARRITAGGPDHHAAYLANSDGYEVELVARPEPLEPAAGSPDPVNPPEPPQ
jgi:hypothetical protein